VLFVMSLLVQRINREAKNACVKYVYAILESGVEFPLLFYMSNVHRSSFFHACSWGKLVLRVFYCLCLKKCIFACGSSLLSNNSQSVLVSLRLRQRRWQNKNADDDCSNHSNKISHLVQCLMIFVNFRAVIMNLMYLVITCKTCWNFNEKIWHFPSLSNDCHV
jgi:hypothetical protein